MRAGVSVAGCKRLKATNLRNLDDLTVRFPLYSSCFPGVFAQRQVSSPVLVISTITRFRARRISGYAGGLV
jgi:hypothetical protein